MAKIGYARVSKDDMHPENQADRLTADGCERIFTDHGETGRKASRPQWDACLAFLRAGDTLVIVRLDRMGRSIRNLIDVANSLHDRDIALRVLDQAIDTSTAAGRFFFHVLAALAEMEADLIRERTMDGLAAARARGRTGGRKLRFTPAQEAAMLAMYEAKDSTVAEIAAIFATNRRTAYDCFARATARRAPVAVAS